MKTKLLIFGITGDLSMRKLLPALEQIISTGQFDDLTIIGVSRREVSPANIGIRGTLGERSSIFTMNVAEEAEYERLKRYISLGRDEQLLVYFSIPPQAAVQIVEFLGKAEITTPNVKLLFEKPFGLDVASSKEMIARTGTYYGEEQIYRIDHYLAKEMAQNIVTFRGGNALFDRIWSNEFVESIEIIASETLDIQGRAQFYEQTGALRDVVQGHLMQLLSLTLMDIPVQFDWSALPKLRLAALGDLQPADPTKAVRAQYRGYQDEVENPGSNVETFVSLELESNHSRWQGVPIRLMTGKALDKKTTEVRIYLKKSHEAQSNCIVFKIQPDEGIDIKLFVKKPGYARELETKTLGFNFPEDTKLPDAYEQVLVDAISSRKGLFTTSEEVVRSWEILEPLQYAWSMDDGPIPLYEKGSDPATIPYI